MPVASRYSVGTAANAISEVYLYSEIYTARLVNRPSWYLVITTVL